MLAYKNKKHIVIVPQLKFVTARNIKTKKQKKNRNLPLSN